MTVDEAKEIIKNFSKTEAPEMSDKDIITIAELMESMKPKHDPLLEEQVGRFIDDETDEDEFL